MVARRRAGRVGSATDLSRLVGAAQAGDRQAFGELYARYAGMVYSVAVSRVPVDQAADVVQEVFLRALRKLKRLREAAAFGGWITAIARNAARDVERQGRTVEVTVELSRRETQHQEMDARAALRAIRALPAAYRKTIMMRLVQGMTGPEIANRTGLSAASVRVNLHRGMKLLRERLAAPTRKKTP
jgi:RNA polymerase sigma-70 factor, ECF subfamily